MSDEPSTKRRRRTPQEGVDFRNQLIAAARELFAADGFESVSIRRIAERANCPPMTFYVYFKSKRMLLRHIWADVFADLRRACADAIRDEAPPKERVQRYMETMVAYWLDHPDSYRMVYMNQDVVESENDQFFNETMEGGGRFLDLEAVIAAGVAEGAFRPLEPLAVGESLFVAAVGIAHSLITIPEYGWRRDALISNTFELLLRGLGPSA